MQFGMQSQKGEPNPYRGVLILLGFAVLLTMILYVGKVMVSHPVKQPAGAGAGARPTTEPAADELVIQEEAPKPAERVPSYLTDPETLATVQESEVLEGYAFYYLLYQSKIGDAAALAKTARPAGSADEMKALAAGTAVSLEGKVRSIWLREELALPDAGLKRVTQYEIEDAKGNLYLVYATADVTGVDSGDLVKVVGRFLRLFSYVPVQEEPLGEAPEEGAGGRPDAEPEAEPEGTPAAPKTQPEVEARPTPVIITKIVDGSSYLTDASFLKTVENGKPWREPKVFYYLVNLVRGLTQEELKKRVEPKLTAEAITRDPDAAVGRFVMIDGRILQLAQWPQAPNIAGIDRLYRCVLRTPGGQLFWAYTVDEPKGFVAGDGVRVYGVFFKTYLYKTKISTEEVAALVMARGLVRLEYKEPPYLAVGVLMFGIVVITLLIVLALLDRRHARAAAQHVKEMVAKRRPKDIDEVARAIARKRQAEEGDAQEGAKPEEQGDKK